MAAVPRYFLTQNTASLPTPLSLKPPKKHNREAAVHGIGSAPSLIALRKKAAAAAGAGGRAKPPRPPGPRPKTAQGPAWDARLGLYTLPFPGADASVVRRTQAALAAAGEPPVHFSARFGVPSAYYAAVAVAVGGALMTLAKHAWGRALLLRAPGVFSYGLASRKGPTEEQMRAARTTLTFEATGFSTPPKAEEAATAAPDRRVTLRMAFGDPGYLYTAKIMAAAALTLLDERAACLAAAGGAGGVFTAGFLFRDSSLADRLKAEGFKIEVEHHPVVDAAAAGGGGGGADGGADGAAAGASSGAAEAAVATTPATP